MDRRLASLMVVSALSPCALACSSSPSELKDAAGQGDGDGPGSDHGPGYPGDGDGDGLGSGDGDSCASADIKLTQAVPTVWLIVSRMASRTTSITELTSVTDWDNFRSALLGPEGVVTRLQGVVQFGFYLHGGQKDGSCPDMESVAPKLDNFAALSAAFPEMKDAPQDGTLPFGYYPLQDILRQLKERPAGARNAPQGIVWASLRAGMEDVCHRDWFGGLGAGSSSRSETMEKLNVQTVEDIAAAGGKVYMLAGSQRPGTSDQEQLERLAAAGNTGFGPFHPTNEAELVQALRSIAGDLVDCSVTLNGEVGSGRECEGKVEVDERTLPCNDANGWRLKDSHTIELVGEACQSLRSKPESKIRADFPCEAFVIY